MNALEAGSFPLAFEEDECNSLLSLHFEHAVTQRTNLPNRKLTLGEANQIRKLRRLRVPYKEICARYGITTGVIQQIVKGVTYKEK